MKNVTLNYNATELFVQQGATKLIIQPASQSASQPACVLTNYCQQAKSSQPISQPTERPTKQAFNQLNRQQWLKHAAVIFCSPKKKSRFPGQNEMN